MTTALFLSGCASTAYNKLPANEAALSKIIWQINHPMKERKAGAQKLLRRNSALFKKQAKKYLLDLQRWKMLKFVLGVIVKKRWKDFTYLIIQSWARKSIAYNDKHRPERAALASLYKGKSVNQILINTFYNSAKNNKNSNISQISAWAVLNRLLNKNKVRTILSNAPNDTFLINSLNRAAKVLNLLPHSKQSILWLFYNLNSNSKMWQTSVRLVNKLSKKQRRGLALRHLPALAHSSKQIRAKTPKELYRAIKTILKNNQHQQRTTSKTGDLFRSVSEKLSTSQSDLCWGDLAQIKEILGAMNSAKFISAIFAQADKDLKDKTSEHGGVITWKNAKVTPVSFPSAIRGNDRRFVASNILLKNLYTGLAHYHFHAQKYDNSAWAGPGGGDLNFASHFATGAVVFTFINKNKINVDFYKPGNVVIDLGMIRRKGGK